MPIDIKNVEFKKALGSLREFRRLEKSGSSKAASMFWVSKVYKAVHTFFPVIQQMSQLDEAEKQHLVYRGSATHYYDLFNEVYCSVMEGKRTATPTLIRLELVKTTIVMHERSELHNPSDRWGTFGKVTTHEDYGITNKYFGREFDKRFPFEDLHFVKQFEFISKWMTVENHLNDMVNLCLATAMVANEDYSHSVRTDTAYW